MADVDVQKNIQNTDDLIRNMQGEAGSIIADYGKVADEWKAFLDKELTDNGISFSPTDDEQTKIDKLSENLFYSSEAKQSKFLNSLKSEVQKKDSKREELKALAEEVLEKQKALVEENKALLESVKESLKADAELEAKLESEIEKINNDIAANQQKIDERVTRISILEAEIADPAISPEDKKAKSAELSVLRKEEKDLTDKNFELESDVKTKKQEKSKIDVNGKTKKFDDLEKKNKELEQNIEKTTKDFKAKGIEVEAQSAQAVAQTPAENVQTDPNVVKAQKGDAAGVQAVAASDSKQLVKLTDRQIANNMAREFRNARTTKEQRAVIDGYGYSDIAGMMEYLGPIQKRKLRNVLKEEIYAKKVPAVDEFKDKLEVILGSENDAKLLYASLFRSNSARSFKDLDADELRRIQNAFDTLDSRRGEIARQDAELLKYFDENVAHFVKYGALVDKGTIGGRMGAFFNFGGKKVVRNKLVNSMKDYTMNTQEEKVKKINFVNDIRAALGQEIVDVPSDPANENRNRDTEYSNPLQDRRASGKSSTSKER